MCLRSIGCALLTGLCLTIVAGCEKSGSNQAAKVQETQPDPPKISASETVARIHWLGKKRLTGETNAAFFMSVWDLPESSKLEAQTLDKLALTMTGLLSNSTNPAAATNSGTVALVRPLLEDLVKEESYIEVRSTTNRPGELGLAIRLNEDRAGMWETTLPKALSSIAGATKLTSAGNGYSWQLEFENRKSKIKKRLSLARIGTWTLLTLIDSAQPSPGSLLGDLTARIQGMQPPFAAVLTNFWLEADVDMKRLGRALGCDWSLPAEMPRVSLTMMGDGLNVRTRGELTFAKPLTFKFEPWNIPTNLVHDPLVSFTAINGIRPSLEGLAGWTNLTLRATPNQVYLWGMEGAAVETYFAAPISDASNAVYALSGRLIHACNPWLATNKMGELDRATDSNGLSWTGFPFVAPFLKSVSWGSGFAFGGLGPEVPLTNSMPEPLIAELTRQTNLCYYDWEITGPRIGAGLYIGQLLRVMGHKAQLPEKCSSMLWLKALGLKLGNCGTEVTMTDSTHLAFLRKSSLGFTAAELNFLADWFESPIFPYSIHSLVAPSPNMVGQRVATDTTPR